MPGAFAFYQRTREGDFVFMRSLEPKNYSVVVHEYTHFIAEHAGLKLPIWLNEGLADFYSTMESREAQVIVGTAPPGREATLHGQNWMDWHTLTEVDRESPYYRQPEKMLLFYSQSWAFVHMLALNTAYENKFQGFLATMSGNSSAENALSATYHKTLEDLGSETEQEMKAKRVESRTIDLDIRQGVLQSAEVADSVKQAEFAFADVLAANPNVVAEAKVRLEVLVAKYPDDPRAEESLGFLTMKAGLKSDAEAHFVRAVKNHSEDPEVLFSLAHLQLARGGSDEEAIQLLQRAIARNGTYYNALLELGFTAAKIERFDLAIEALSKITEPKIEHAFDISYTLAYCLSELHQNSRAKLAAELARKIAVKPHDKEEVAELLTYIKQESKQEEASR
jgi:Flp pilus assembly protein TadD